MVDGPDECTNVHAEKRSDALDYSHRPVYTPFLTTSYKGQLLEITFTSNLNTRPELKKEIDHIMESVRLEYKILLILRSQLGHIYLRIASCRGDQISITRWALRFSDQRGLKDRFDQDFGPNPGRSG